MHLPKSAIIKKVILQLSYDVSDPFDSTTNNEYRSFPGHSHGMEECCNRLLSHGKRIKVTWNTQPKTVEANQVYISPFIRNVNFIEVDVTSCLLILLQRDSCLSELRNAYSGYGHRISSPASALHQAIILKPTMRPKLTVYYTMN